jgi:outer membrane receptor protein involved in Fe transport
MTRHVVTAILGLSALVAPAKADEESQKRTEPYMLGAVVVTGQTPNRTANKPTPTGQRANRAARKPAPAATDHVTNRAAGNVASSGLDRASDQATSENTSTVTEEQIAQKGARSLDEAVRAVPGVVVTSGGQSIPRIMIRGLPPRQTQIFLNGVPLNSAVDGQFDPSLDSDREYRPDQNHPGSKLGSVWPGDDRRRH